jgi:hypothetical protein
MKTKIAQAAAILLAGLQQVLVWHKQAWTKPVSKPASATPQCVRRMTFTAA